MKKTVKGAFIKVLCCTECDWFHVPVGLHLVPSPPPPEICRACGGSLELTIGQYKSRKTKRWFEFEWRYEVIDFIRKEQQQEKIQE